jgi:hypothetical protein
MEKSNHVSYPVPSVRKYDFVAPNLAHAQRNPRDIASYCRGRGPDRSGLGLTADAATTQSKTARVRLVFRERVLDPCFDQIGNVSPAPPDPAVDGVATTTSAGTRAGAASRRSSRVFVSSLTFRILLQL